MLALWSRGLFDLCFQRFVLLVFFWKQVSQSSSGGGISEHPWLRTDRCDLSLGLLLTCWEPGPLLCFPFISLCGFKSGAFGSRDSFSSLPLAQQSSVSGASVMKIIHNSSSEFLMRCHRCLVPATSGSAVGTRGIIGAVSAGDAQQRK